MPAIALTLNRPAMPSTDGPTLHAMATHPWFAALDADTRHALLAVSEPLHLRDGEYVFRQGDRTTGFHGLVRGRLRASTLREDGREAVLAILERGNWFGEASAIDGLPRTHDVSAVGDVDLLVVAQHDFDTLMQRNAFARGVALLQARYMRAVFAMLEDATLRATRARVARRLQRLAHGTDIQVTHDTLAMMLGITRQTLALELKALAQAGAIRTGYGRIEIVSAARLAEAAV